MTVEEFEKRIDTVEPIGLPFKRSLDELDDKITWHDVRRDNLEYARIINENYNGEISFKEIDKLLEIDDPNVRTVVVGNVRKQLKKHYNKTMIASKKFGLYYINELEEGK